MSLLQQCIQSIQEQLFLDYEVWIIDGASTDGTRAYLEELPAPFYHISEPDTGIYNAMNKGIERATGKWCYFMGADDTLYDTSVLANVAKHIPLDHTVMLGKIVMHNDERKLLSRWANGLWLKNTVHHQATFYNKTIFEKRSYDETLKVLADYKLNLQLYREGISSEQIPYIIARCGDQGISKKYSWSLYQEEIDLKVKESSIFFWPFFFKIAFLKFLLKNISLPMKNLILTLLLLFTVTFSFAQNNQFQEDIFREEINLELIKNYTGCELFWSKKGISQFNGKTEIWSVCSLKNGNRFIRIESYKDETFYQELYFEKNGNLRYAKETENFNPKNRFAEMKWNCQYYLEDGKLMTNISLGHGKTEDENWHPKSIVEMYNKRVLQLKKLES